MPGGVKVSNDVDIFSCAGYRAGVAAVNAQRGATVRERNELASSRLASYVRRPECGGGQGPPDKGRWTLTL